MYLRLHSCHKLEMRFPQVISYFVNKRQETTVLIQSFLECHVAIYHDSKCEIALDNGTFERTKHTLRVSIVLNKIKVGYLLFPSLWYVSGSFSQVV